MCWSLSPKYSISGWVPWLSSSLIVSIVAEVPCMNMGRTSWNWDWDGGDGGDGRLIYRIHPTETATDQSQSHNPETIPHTLAQSLGRKCAGLPTLGSLAEVSSVRDWAAPLGPSVIGMDSNHHQPSHPALMFTMNEGYSLCECVCVSVATLASATDPLKPK